MHEHHHDSSDKELERCVDELKGDGAALPSFDDIIARKAGSREPLLNGRTATLLVCVMLLGATIWWQGNDNAPITPVAEENQHYKPGHELLDFGDCFAAIDQHFRSNDVEFELSNWSTPSDTLLIMNIRTNHGALDNVEF